MRRSMNKGECSLRELDERLAVHKADRAAIIGDGERRPSVSYIANDSALVFGRAKEPGESAEVNIAR